MMTWHWHKHPTQKEQDAERFNALNESFKKFKEENASAVCASCYKRDFTSNMVKIPFHAVATLCNKGAWLYPSVICGLYTKLYTNMNDVWVHPKCANIRRSDDNQGWDVIPADKKRGKRK